jgi:hypothetical protein
MILIAWKSLLNIPIKEEEKKRFQFCIIRCFCLTQCQNVCLCKLYNLYCHFLLNLSWFPSVPFLFPFFESSFIMISVGYFHSLHPIMYYYVSTLSFIFITLISQYLSVFIFIIWLHKNDFIPWSSLLLKYSPYFTWRPIQNFIRILKKMQNVRGIK